MKLFSDSQKFILKKFFSLRIKTKFLLSYLLVIFIIAVAVVGITLYTSMQVLEGRTREISMQLVTQISENIEQRAKELGNLSHNLMLDVNLRKLSTLVEAELDDEIYLVHKEARTAIETLAFANKYVKYVCVKSVSGKYYWWEKNIEDSGKVSLNSNFVKEIFLRYEYKLNNLKNEAVWLPSYNNSEVLLMRTISDYGTESKSLGTIVLGIDSSLFRSLGSQKSIIKEDNIAVLDKNNNVLLYGILNSRQILDLAGSSDILYSPSSNTRIKYRETEYLITKNDTDDFKWKVFCFIPVYELLAGYNTLKTLILLICAASIVIGAVIAFMMSTNITRNISNLEKNMRYVEEGNLNVRVKPTSYDEIGLLGLRFNYMVSRINTLINNVTEERLAKQQAEFQVLQAQINPHFLYNTLGSVKWFARMKNQVEIENMINALIMLLKATINRKSEFQTVSEEISYVKNYLALQKMRYEDRFIDRYEIDETIAGYEVLNFILQPLVENALFHGLEMSKNVGVINIRAARQGDIIKLEVEDNGIGMSSEMIKKILTIEHKKTYPGLNSIGVKLVNERIKLYYGEQFGISYFSEEGHGTKVEVILPYEDKVVDVICDEGNDC